MKIEDRVKNLERLCDDLNQKYHVMTENYIKMVFAHHHSYRADMATLEGLYMIEKKSGTKFKWPHHWDKVLKKANGNLRDLAEKYIISFQDDKEGEEGRN